MDIGEHVRLYAPELDPFLNLALTSKYPEDLFREACHRDPVYGSLDLTERDTSL